MIPSNSVRRLNNCIHSNCFNQSRRSLSAPESDIMIQKLVSCQLLTENNVNVIDNLKVSSGH